MIQLPPDWLTLLQDEFKHPHLQTIKDFLTEEINQKQTLFPEPKDIFNAFNYCSLDQLKVVILGQDPYHSLSTINPSQGGEPSGGTVGFNPKSVPTAHGLSFSISQGITKLPPSLQNIFKELHTDVDFTIPQHGNLEPWAHQGVLLLNAALTVRAHQANSHAHIGWHSFTDHVIQKISDHKDHLVFLLWGNFARSKKKLINSQKHLVLEAPHPSPFSAHSGFFGCRHFSQTNKWLREKKLEPINWQV